jgi:uncharacterized membrane-anchored protein YjiN (DUF445 family)
VTSIELRAAASGEDEAGQRRSLQRNRRFATGLLLLAAAIFLATGAVGSRGFWLGLLHAGAEAALVGGLADWFAVTALFRHPLGLPIPHTAVLPRSKDRIGEGLGRFVERNFLAPEILAAKLRQLEPSRRIADWLAEPMNARRVAEQVADGLPHLVRSLEDRELRDFAARSFREQLREADLAPFLGQAVRLLTTSGQFDALLDRALDAAQRAVLTHADRLYAMVTERSRWWVPKTVDRRIAENIIDGILALIGELRLPGSETRAEFHRGAERMAERLIASPEWRQRIAETKDRLLEQPQVQAWLLAVWDELRRIVLEDLASPASRTREALHAGLLSLGRTLDADPAMQQRIDGAIEHVALAVVPWRGQIAALIAEVVRGWDAETVTARLELAVGSDLQYIRMNGTLVGAVVGCVLFLVARFLGGLW